MPAEASEPERASSRDGGRIEGSHGRKGPHGSFGRHRPSLCPEWIQEHRGSHDKHRKREEHMSSILRTVGIDISKDLRPVTVVSQRGGAAKNRLAGRRPEQRPPGRRGQALRPLGRQPQGRRGPYRGAPAARSYSGLPVPSGTGDRRSQAIRRPKGYPNSSLIGRQRPLSRRGGDDTSIHVRLMAPHRTRVLAWAAPLADEIGAAARGSALTSHERPPFQRGEVLETRPSRPPFASRCHPVCRRRVAPECHRTGVGQ